MLATQSCGSHGAHHGWVRMGSVHGLRVLHAVSNIVQYTLNMQPRRNRYKNQDFGHILCECLWAGPPQPHSICRADDGGDEYLL